jgi:hypothetical protein
LEVPSPLPEANPLETGPLEAPATAAAALFDDAVKSGAAGAVTDPRTIVVRARSVARAARAARAADAAHQGAADGHAGGAEAAAGVHRSVGQPQTPTMRLERHNATDAFFDRLLSSGSGSSIRTSNGSGGSGGSSSGGRDVWLEGAVLAQLVLRPSPALRQLVEQFERSLFTPPQNHTTAGAAAAAPQAARAVGHKAGTGAPGGRHAMTSPHAPEASYVVIHLRAFGPSCTVRVTRALDRRRQTVTPQQLGGRPVVAADICGMSDAYVDAALAAHADRFVKNGGGGSSSSSGSGSSAAGLRWPVVLAHDGEDEARAAALVAKYGARVYRGPMAPFVDLLLMVRAGLLVGNPASSFSANAARVRYAAAAAKVAAAPPGTVMFHPGTTLRCGGEPGLDPAQC